MGQLTILVTVVGAVWSLAWWLSNQFSSVKSMVYLQIEKLENTFLDKLEYHERHDDTRFTAISADLNDIKLRAAAIKVLYLNTEDGNMTPISKKIKKLLKEEVL